MPPLCELHDVHKNYSMGEVQVPALAGVSIAIAPGEFTVFAGPSGSGKTTLLNLVGLLDVASSGRVLLEGRDTATLSASELAALRARRIGFVFQSFNLIPVLSAAENVELALRLAGDGTSAARAAQVNASLADVGLDGLGQRRPAQLSGGQQQRVAIARALVKAPALVIADEPTANLDSQNGEAIVALMQRMNREKGATFVISSHDPMVIAHARRVVRLRDGRVEEVEARAGTAAS